MKYLIMEKKYIHRFNQYGEILIENYIDWSIAFHKDDISSDEEGFAEPVVKCIIGKKIKWLSEMQPDQYPDRDLVINVKKKRPPQHSMKQCKSKELFIDKAFKNILQS